MLAVGICTQYIVDYHDHQRFSTVWNSLRLAAAEHALPPALAIRSLEQEPLRLPEPVHQVEGTGTAL